MAYCQKTKELFEAKEAELIAIINGDPSEADHEEAMEDLAFVQVCLMEMR